MLFHLIYFGCNLYGYQSHMIVAFMKVNTGLINFPLPKKNSPLLDPDNGHSHMPLTCM
jgi:hypothetical protein